MIARAGSGWQTIMADLSLILFMVTAAAVDEAPASPPIGASAPALADPVALWRAAPGGPLLSDWLKDQPADPRLRITIYADPAAAPGALALAAALPRPARVVLEQGLGPAPSAALTYDIPVPEETSP